MTIKNAVIFLAAMIGCYVVLAALGAENLRDAMGEVIIILTTGYLFYQVLSPSPAEGGKGKDENGQ